MKFCDRIIRNKNSIWIIIRFFCRNW